MNISVVIPTHNRPHTLRLCLQSILAGDTVDCACRIHVVDDCSPPGASRLNEKYCLSFGVDYVRIPHRRGPSTARNIGARRATGEWTAFIDDDITVDRDWLRVLRDTIESSEENVVGIEGSVRPGGNGLWDHEVQNTRGGQFLSCNIAYRSRVFLGAGGFDVQMNHPFHEDHELAVRMRRLGEIHFQPRLHATHSPREIRFTKQLPAGPKRIFHLLCADRYFWKKHPAEYRRFRFHSTFYQTYRAVLLRHTYTSIKRRGLALLLQNPGSIPLLVLISLVEQITAGILFPYFLYLSVQDHPAGDGVWFAGAIPSKSNGGVARNMRGLAGELQRTGQRVEVITAPHRFRGTLGFMIFLAFRLLLSLRSGPPRWIIARSSDGWLCLKLIRLLHIPSRLILHNHGWEEWPSEIAQRTSCTTGPRPLATPRSHILRFPLLRSTARGCTGIICGTVNEMRQLKKKYPFTSGKFVYLPNGVTETALRHRRIHDTSSPRFLCIGAWGWRKNLSASLTLFDVIHKSIPTARLSLLGCGNSDELCRFVNTFSCRDNVEIHPSVPMNCMDQHYRNADYLLSASRYEGGHALAVLEAMARGCLVFVSPIESHTEFVHDGHNGFILSMRISDDTHRIITIMRDLRLQQAVSDAAVRTAKRNTWKRPARRLRNYLCRTH